MVNAWVLNIRTGIGQMPDRNGSLSVLLNPSDTIIFSAQNYKIFKFRLLDSLFTFKYEYTIQMERKALELLPVVVVPERDLSVIHEEITELKKEKYNPYPDMVRIESPITALYLKFSKKGKELTKLNELIYEDRKKELLKELLAKYVRYDIIELTDSEFESFIDFCQLDSEYIRNSSEYDLIMLIRKRYEAFRNYRPAMPFTPAQDHP